LAGGASLVQPLSLAKGDPYPPIWFSLNVVVVVAESPAGLAAFGGIAAILRYRVA